MKEVLIALNGIDYRISGRVETQTVQGHDLKEVADFQAVSFVTGEPHTMAGSARDLYELHRGRIIRALEAA